MPTRKKWRSSGTPATLIRGQACVAGKRFIVADALYDDFVSRLVSRMRSAKVGDLDVEEGCDLGALSSIEAAERVEGQVRGAVAQGATLLAGGERDGAAVSPGVLADVTPGMDAYGAEIFGPIAMVHRVADEAEAVAVANDTPYGLGSYVFTTDPYRQREWRTRSTPEWSVSTPASPRGTTIRSGAAKRAEPDDQQGLLAADEFVNMKLIHTEH